jgi:chorismate dehydratase
LALGGGWELSDCVPSELGTRAAAGELAAGLLPVADYLRLSGSFARLGRLGIAVRGRARSVYLFSRRPIKQLDGAAIAVTDETSTTAVLLRLLLEQRYGLTPAGYVRVPGIPAADSDAEALVLIGDAALRFKATNRQYPFEVDLAFEWWLWQHLPFVFAVWAVRKDMSADDQRTLEMALTRALGVNSRQLEAVATERFADLAMPVGELTAYLGGFIYRLGPQEEEGLTKFSELANEHHLL